MREREGKGASVVVVAAVMPKWSRKKREGVGGGDVGVNPISFRPYNIIIRKEGKVPERDKGKK